MSAVAIFVKTPGLSPLKTRLAADWGKERAEQVYRMAALTVLELAEAAAIGPVYWAVAESLETAARHWPGKLLIAQGEGGLGERMGRVHARLVSQHGAGLLLGADSPQIDPAWLQLGAEWLDDSLARLCVGPSSDGGFWTIGANRPLPQHLWEAVPYSRSDTLAQFQTRMATQGKWLRLPGLTDLDSIDDISGLIEQLQALDQPTRQQRKLLAWLREHQP